MDCPSCQETNPQDARYCEQCGAALQQTCPQCQETLSPTSNFCKACGHDLSHPATSASLEAAQPPEPSNLIGERRQATVMFSDLSGYAAMNERLDPEEVQGVLQRIKETATRIIESHGGFVSQFVGDEVLALFGIPVAHEDDPAQAVRAAVKLHRFVRGLSPEVDRKLGQPIRLHTGISTGLIVTSMKDTRDGLVGVTGDTVNIGARLKAEAASDTILLSPITKHLVEEFFETESLPHAVMRGKATPIVPYRLTGEKPVASRFEAARARGLTPFTGREDELANLHKCLVKAKAGEGQFVTVVGEAAIGKSRLAYEFRHGIDHDKITVLEGSCHYHGAGTPYLPFQDALSQGLHLQGEEDPQVLCQMAVEKIRSIDPALEPFISHYLHLVSIPSPDYPMPEDLQGDDLRRSLENALAAIFTLSSRRKPVVLILEDWHWSDEASNSALKNMIGMVSHYPLMVVILYRPEYTRSWGDMEHYTAILLKSFDIVHTQNILRAVIAADTTPEELGQRVHTHTGGNPFFIEEIGRALIDDGTVIVQDGKALLSRAAEHLALPDTIEALIRTRLDRLDADAQGVLRIASVIGRIFSGAILERIYSDRKRLSVALDELKAQNLVQQTQILPEAVYIFRHVLTVAVVYETLLLRRRKELHGQVARAIEVIYQDRIEEHCESLAYHYTHSEETEKSIHYLERAGDKAAGYYSMDEARNNYESVIEILDGLDMTPEQQRQLIDINLKWAAATFYTANEAQLKKFQSALEIADKLGDGARLLKTTNILGRIHYSKGNMSAASTLFEKCVEMAQAQKDHTLLALPYNIIGRTKLYSAEFIRGIDYLQKGIPMIEKEGNQEEIAWSKSMLALTLAWIGNFREALPLLEHVIDMTRKDGNLIAESAALSRSGYAHVLHGDWREAILAFSQAIEISQRIGNKILSGQANGALGYAAFHSGGGREAIADIERGIQAVESAQSYFGLSVLYAWLGEALSISGASDQGRIAAQKSLSIREFGERYGEVTAHRTMAMALAGKPDFEWSQVDEYMHEGIRMAQERNERPSQALMHCRYAEILHKKGDLDAAREQLGKANSLFHEMEMTWWLEQTQVLMGHLEQGLPFSRFAPYVDGPQGN